MANPLAAIISLTSLWKESAPLRAWLWGKMPMVKDAKKRDLIEGLLAQLLEDANKLAQSVPADEVDAHLNELLVQFRKDIEAQGIKGADADAFVERANLLARLMVTGPLGNLIEIRGRLATQELALEAAERTITQLTHTTGEHATRVAALEKRVTGLHTVAIVAATSSILALLIALAAIVIHR